MIVKALGALAKVYALHLLTFTVGAFLGAFEAFGILYVMWGPK